MWCIFKKHDSELKPSWWKHIFFPKLNSNRHSSTFNPYSKKGLSKLLKVNLALIISIFNLFLWPTFKIILMEKLNQCIMQGQVERGLTECEGLQNKDLKPPSQSAPPTCVQVTKRKFKLQKYGNPRQARALALVPGSWPPHSTCTVTRFKIWGETARPSLAKKLFLGLEFTRTRKLDLFEPTDEVVASLRFSVFLNFENSSAGVNSEAGSQGPESNSLTKSCYV